MMLPEGLERLKKVRIAIPPDLPCQSYSTSEIFDFLHKNQGLTEEFIYNNTSSEPDQLPIYTASYEPIGYLPRSTQIRSQQLTIANGEVIIIFRQGYAGQMYIPDEREFFPSEHTVPVRVKPEFANKLNQQWFVRHYEPEVLHYVTGKADSRNFSELAFLRMSVLIPPKSWQDDCAKLYRLMDETLKGAEKTLGTLSVDGLPIRPNTKV